MIPQFIPKPRPLPPHRLDDMAKLAKHEVGHLIAAKIVGFPTGQITIQVDIRGGFVGGAEITLPRSLRSVDDTKKYLRDRVIVLWAGALSETLHGNMVDQEVACKTLNRPGETDHPKARELVNLLRNLTFPDAPAANVQEGLTALERELWSQTIDLVQGEAALILGLAARLAGMVTTTSTLYTLSSVDIARTPDVIKRFGASA